MKERVEILSIEPTTKHSRDLYKLSYLQDGKEESDIVSKGKDVVKILLYHTQKNAFVLTKQFRPFLYINHPKMAFRVELCGGGVEDGLSAKESAIKEVLEETGYKVDNLEKITTLYTTVRMTLYYAKVDESMRISSGGGADDDEMIEVLYLPLERAKEFMFDESIPKRPALMFSFCWFLNMKE